MAIDTNSVTSICCDKQSIDEVDAYWTEERIRDAQPFPLPQLNDDQFRRLTVGPDALETAPGQVYTLESGPGLETAGVPTPADVSKRPYWNGGVVFFTGSDGKDYYGSCEIVGSNHVMMTAAHCVMDGSTGALHKNFRFIRAYKNGGGQSVGWDCMAVMSNWHTNGPNYPYDYAFVNTDKASGAGWLGFKTGIPYATWTSIGYPINYGGGRYMYQVEGSKGTVAGNIVQMQQNPFLGGSSGGAWIGELTVPHVGGNYAIGLNSFGYNSQPTNMYGPLFDSTTYDLLVYVMNKQCIVNSAYSD